MSQEEQIATARQRDIPNVFSGTPWKPIDISGVMRQWKELIHMQTHADLPHMVW